MDQTKQNADNEKAAGKGDAREPGKKKGKAKFEPPKVITYSGDDILDELGPAHACSPFSGSVVAC